MDTFEDFKAKVLTRVHPGGLALPLRPVFASDCIQGLIIAQRWIPFFRSHNKTRYDFCSTYFSCGATVIEKPRGELLRLFTIEGPCCPVRGDFVPDFDDFLNWLNATRKTWTEPGNLGMPPLPTGFKFSEDSLDKGRRSDWFRFAFKNDQIWLAPRIESTESIIAEWDGLKRDWADDDLMPYGSEELGDANDAGEELVNLVASFVRYEDLRKYRRDTDGYLVEKAVFNELLAELKHQEWRDAQPKHTGSNPDGIQKYDALRVSGDCRDTECATPDEAGVTDEQLTFAIVGDYGDYDEAAQAVAAMVIDWGPCWILTAGDNWYDTSLLLTDFEEKAAKLYRNWIFPYRSFATPKLTSTALENAFFPTIGNHDRDPVGHLDIELSLLNVPDVLRGGAIQPSTGYYSHVHGDNLIEIFHYDSGYDNTQTNQQADGIDLNSAQAAWLELALSRSKARWKIVIAHHPGYTSTPTVATEDTLVGDGKLNYTAIRNITNKLKLWGADALVHGHAHNYERLDVMGLPVIINGAGGRVLKSFDGSDPNPFSQTRYEAAHGAMLCTVSCASLRMDFYNVDGDLIDSLIIGDEEVGTGVRCRTTRATCNAAEIVQNITNNSYTTVGVRHYMGGFIDPNGNQNGNPGDLYSSLVSLGGDGRTWRKASGTGSSGWE